MTETIKPSSFSHEATPGDLASFLQRKKTLGVNATGAAVNAELPKMEDGEAATKVAETLPGNGVEYIDDGVTYRFAPSYKYVRNYRTGQSEKRQYTLRDYFSHTAADGQNGPGWDSRFSIMSNTPEEMMRRYGHVFTIDEARSPQTMPDDVFYYDLVTKDEYRYREEHDLL